jgi:hypothetical protein
MEAMAERELREQRRGDAQVLARHAAPTEAQEPMPVPSLALLCARRRPLRTVEREQQRLYPAPGVKSNRGVACRLRPVGTILR